MSELINTQNAERGFRWHFLTSVSALALLAAVNARDAKAADEDADRPTIWIELGGQLEHAGGQGDPFTPGFVAANPSSPVLQPVSPLQAQNPLPFSFAEEGSISFQPEDSDWVFSADVRIGRSSNFSHVDHQTKGLQYAVFKYGAPDPSGKLYTTANFADTQARHQESHVILDFSAGKDIGLGLFGRNGSSTLSLGVRFAQFASKATLDLRARPDLQFQNITLPDYHVTLHLNPHFHTYQFTGYASRSFHGVGPSLSWNGSTPFLGNPHDSEMTFDWGVNMAILFGRQKARVRHHEFAHYVLPTSSGKRASHYALVYQHSGGHDTDRTVFVPNVGGFAGASYRIENFKVSLGYRADFFFGAIDGGIDMRKSETLGFYGPFASVSVGIGG